MDKIIVVSPHPDDETFGAGGTILSFKRQGHKVYWLIVTSMKEEFGFKKERVRARKREIEKIRNEYGFNGFFDLELRPTGVDGYPISSIVEKISGVFNKIKPTIVILPFRNDIHSDHRIVFDAAYACTKVFRHSCIKKILMMEVVSETDFAVCDVGFLPNYFIDISDYLEKKIRIMKVFKGEKQVHPFPRSKENIKALAVMRGSQAGCKYAESFMILKEIER